MTKFSNREVIKKAEKVIDGAIKVYKFITFDKSSTSFTDLRESFYAFLPVLLVWFVRLSVVLVSYMYNSYIGLCHLLWMMASFLIP